MIEDTPPKWEKRSGLGTTLKLLTGDLFAALSQRVELGAIELQSAARRGIWGLALMLGASVMGVLALLFLTLCGVWALGRDNLVLAFLITGAAYLVLALGAIVIARKIMLKKPLPFRALVSVLKEDSEWILGKKPH